MVQDERSYEARKNEGHSRKGLQWEGCWMNAGMALFSCVSLSEQALICPSIMRIERGCELSINTSEK